MLLAVGLAQASTPCSPRAVERRDRACARARAWLRDKQLACPEFFALPAGADPCAACPEPPISTGTPCGLGPPGGTDDDATPGSFVAAMKVVTRFPRVAAHRFFSIIQANGEVYLLARTGPWPNASPGERLIAWAAGGAALEGVGREPAYDAAQPWAHNFAAWADGETLFAVGGRGDSAVTVSTELGAWGWRRRGARPVSSAHAGCLDFLPSFKGCEWDGKFSAAHLGSQLLLYGRMNTGSSRRWAQVSVGTRAGRFGTFHPLEIEGMTPCEVRCNSLYTVSVKANPAVPGTLLGLFPFHDQRAKPPRCSLGLAVSRDGRRFGRPRQIMETRCLANGRSADLPVDGIVIEGDVVYFYVHRDMPSGSTAVSGAYDPRLVRFEVSLAVLANFTRSTLPAAVTDAAGDGFPKCDQKCALSEDGADFARGSSYWEGYRGRRPNRDRVALCVVGQLRTYSMPFVYENLKNRLVDPWAADVFFLWHDDYGVKQGLTFGARSASTPHRGGAAACEYDAQAFAHLGPSLVQKRKYGGDNCTIHASHWRMIAACFDMVLAHEKKNGIKYDVFARTRPDFVLFKPPFPTSSIGPFIDGWTHLDIFFALRRASKAFAKLARAAADPNFQPCKMRGCCMDAQLKRLGQTRVRDDILKGGLVRNHKFVETWSTEAGVKWSTRLARGLDDLRALSCNYAAVPDFERAPCHGQPFCFDTSSSPTLAAEPPGCPDLAEKTGEYAVISRTATPRGNIAYLRNPKTGSEAILHDMLGYIGFTARARFAPEIVQCGDRLARGANLRHQVGCVACNSTDGLRLGEPPRASVGPGDLELTRGFLASRARLAVLREPAERFASAWFFLRRKYPELPVVQKFPCAADWLRANAEETLWNHRLVLWPQAYWIEPVLRGRPDATAVVACYAPNLLDRIAAALRAEFGCRGGPANLSSGITPRNTAENWTSGVKKPKTAKPGTRAPACSANETAASVVRDLRAEIRTLYAADARLWDCLCGT